MPKALSRIAPNKAAKPAGSKGGVKRKVHGEGAENKAARALVVRGRKDTPRKVRQGAKLAMSKSKRGKSARAAFLAPDPLLEETETTKVCARGCRWARGWVIKGRDGTVRCGVTERPTDGQCTVSINCRPR